MRVIAADGVEGLSLRAVARRLGVSHQAPYKHFASRDHLLAEVIRRCLRGFAHHLTQAMEGAQPPGPEPAIDALGHAYLDFALTRPLEYRLMFATPWPDAAFDADFRADACAAFDVLCGGLAAVRPDLGPDALRRHAMYVWSAMHGIAGVLQSGSMRYLGLDEGEQAATLDHVMTIVGQTILPQGPLSGA